jgi:hypothetical protein
MRYYLIDEISKSDMEKIDEFLKQHAIRSEMEKVFWVRIPKEILSDIQSQHCDCQPHLFSIELETDQLKVEFFVRNLNRFKCTCQGYCTLEQRNFILNFSQNMIEELGIKT